jgi:hypothetical protein
MELDEPEILDGMRGWIGSQRALAGVPDPTRARRVLDVGWYDTGLDDHEGAFCMARAGSALEELVGDVVQVQWRKRTGLLYCVGAAAIPTDLALSRPAYLRFAALADETFRAVVQAVIQAGT